MPEKTGDVLADLIKTYGVRILEDPDRLSQFLEDRCASSADEVFRITFALRCLLKNGWRPTKTRLLPEGGCACLSERLGFTEEQAEEVVSLIQSVLDGADGEDGAEEEEFVAVPGNLRRISGGISNRPRGVPIRKSSLFNGIVMIAVLAVLGVLFFQIGSQRTPVGDELRIAFFAPMSGPEARLSHIQLRAAQLAVERINMQEPLRGEYKLKVIGYDLPKSPAAAEAAVRRVMRDKSILVMMLGAGTADRRSIAAVADSIETPLVVVAPETDGGELMDGSLPRLYSFSLANDASYRGKMLSYFAIQALKKKNLALYYDTSDKAVEAVAASARKWALGFGARMAGELTYVKKTNTGHTPAMKALAESGADLLVLPGRGEESAEIVKAARAAGFEGPVVAESYNDAIYDAAGPALRGSWWINEASDLDPPIRSVLREYKSLYNENCPPMDVESAILAYDGIQWIAQALRDAPGFRGEAIRHTLLATKNLPLTHATLTVDPRDHLPLNKAMAVIFCAKDKGIYQRRVRAGKD